MTEESYEGIRHTSKHGRPTYVMVTRKLFITWLTTNLILVILIVASFQYTNYVDRRSNAFWCKVVTTEFKELRSEFKCE